MANVSAKLSPMDYMRVKELEKKGYALNVAEFVRHAVHEKLDEVYRSVEIRNISGKQAKSEIKKYFDDHKIAYPSDIAMDLQLDYEFVLEMMNDLKEEGKIRELEELPYGY